MRKQLLLHAVSLLLFVASLLLYEVTLLIMLSSVLLYRLRVPWRTAVMRWAVDCAVLIPLVLSVTLASSSGHQETEAGLYAHGIGDFHLRSFALHHSGVAFRNRELVHRRAACSCSGAGVLVYLRRLGRPLLTDAP